MTTYRPTRACPHPLCRPLHATATAGVLLTASAVAPISPWFLGLLLVGALFSVAIYQLVHRQTMTASIKEEIHQTVTVTARPAWARAAAALDAVLTVLILVLLAVVLTNRSDSSWGASPSPNTLLAGVAGGVVITAIGEGLHRLAVRIQPVQTEGPMAE